MKYACLTALLFILMLPLHQAFGHVPGYDPSFPEESELVQSPPDEAGGTIQQYGSIATSTISLAILGILYLIPTMFAVSRGHHQTMAIFMLNLTLGWTILGWLLALIWACTAVSRARA